MSRSASRLALFRLYRYGFSYLMLCLPRQAHSSYLWYTKPCIIMPDRNLALYRVILDHSSPSAIPLCVIQYYRMNFYPRAHQRLEVHYASLIYDPYSAILPCGNIHGWYQFLGNSVFIVAVDYNRQTSSNIC